MAGLKTFAQASAWRYVVDLSEELLSASTTTSPVGQDGLSFVVRMRLEGLFRMKMFDELILEATKILQLERQSLEKNGGLDVTTALQLLLVEVLSLTGRGDEAMSRLHLLKSFLKSPNSPYNSRYWLWKTKSSIVNCSIRMRLWRSAVAELTSMLDEVESSRVAPPRQGWSEADLAGIAKAETILLCRLSRIMLQMGSIKAAVRYCERATKSLHRGGLESDDAAEHVELAKGLVHFAQDQVRLFLFLFLFPSSRNFSPSSPSHSALLFAV